MCAFVFVIAGGEIASACNVRAMAIAHPEISMSMSDETLG